MRLGLAAAAGMLVLSACACAAFAAETFSPATLARARAARDAGLRDDVGYDVLRALCTEVGPRPAGSAGDRRAVAWALATLERLGFANVRAESVTVPHWERGECRVEITAPWPQPMVAVALGGSVATPASGVEAEVVAAQSLDDLKSLGEARVRGKIVFFRGRMERVRTGAGYGVAVAVRGRGAAEAAKLGAVGVVIRSVGTDSNREPHAGAMRYDSTGTRIAALALSAPDADLLDRQLASGRPVRMRMSNTSRSLPEERSANVIGEIPGRGPAPGIVVAGGHLDSWDLAQGAHDDGAGVATMIAAAKLAAAQGALRHTIRVVLFANEEFGLSGGRGYAERHAAEMDRHVAAMESDLGAFDVWGLATGFGPGREALVEPILSVLAPICTEYVGNGTRGGADTGPLSSRGVPAFELSTDARPYFDLHHSANDTFDKVDPALLRENIAGYAALLVLAASGDVDFGRLPGGAPRGR
ncbi:MAG: M20/M25/M40 family metallo-hydrolase [Candidatus Eisenbacteria bacterium]|nr:M20/M25/M40 family metallo-hydrolase [Candidatus Eisenbacteria bacterium]